MSPEDCEHWKQGYGKGDWEGWREFSLQSSQTPTPSVQFNSSCNPRASQPAEKQPLKTEASRSHGNLLPLAYPMGGPRSQDRTHLQCAGPRQSSPRVKPPLPMRKSSENTPVLVRAPAPRRTAGQNLSQHLLRHSSSRAGWTWRPDRKSLTFKAAFFPKGHTRARGQRQAQSCPVSPGHIQLPKHTQHSAT